MTHEHAAAPKKATDGTASAVFAAVGGDCIQQVIPLVGAFPFPVEPELRMIEPNNPKLDVNVLMAKIQAEVSRRRSFSDLVASGELSSPLGADLDHIESLLNAADEKAQIRTRWSGKLHRFPFSASRQLQSLSLKALAFFFKDQRHVNFALIAACRDMLALNVRLGQQVDQLRTRVNRMDDRLEELMGELERAQPDR